MQREMCRLFIFLKKKIGTDTPLKKKKKIAGLGSRVLASRPTRLDFSFFGIFFSINTFLCLFF
jgi:hypothetical protein